MADVRLQRPRTPTIPLAEVVFALVLVSAALALAFVATRSPPRIDRLDVTNPSDTELLVEVRASMGDGPWMPLAIVSPHQTKTQVSVIDQGDEWQFRLSAHGREAGHMLLAKRQLVEQSWRIEIVPEASGERSDVPTR